MNAHRLYLLADRSVFRDMGSGFREKREHFDATDLFFWFLLVIGVFVAIGLIARLLARNDKHRLFNSPPALFRALCRAHDLDRPQRQLLVQLARAQGLGWPARMFLEPAYFQVERLGPELQAQEGAIRALAVRIFAEPAGATSQASR